MTQVDEMGFLQIRRFGWSISTEISRHECVVTKPSLTSSTTRV
jgi:hypothetical protein